MLTVDEEATALDEEVAVAGAEGGQRQEGVELPVRSI